MTALKTSAGHKVEQFFSNWCILINISARASIKIQNVGNTHGYLAGLFKFNFSNWCILINISARDQNSKCRKYSWLSCWYIQIPLLHPVKKDCLDLKMAAILKILKYETQLQFDLRYEKTVPNYANKVFFVVMTSSMASKLPSIFMLRRGWLREQVASIMSCQ